MAYSRQEPPNAVQIELAEGCNLRCAFCGLSGIRTPKENDFKFMSFDVLRDLLSQVKSLDWNPRIEFAMHGEPTMHPGYVDMIRHARLYAPRLSLMMTTNGGGLMRRPGARANVAALFEAGLNVLALDEYEGVNFGGKVREALSDGLDGVEFFEYPDDDRGNPHSRRKIDQRHLVFVRDISQADKGTHSLLNNHGGSAAPPNDKMAGKRCAKPFRELSVRWDGRVAVCCNDWRGAFKCGSVVEDGLDKVWQGEAMRAARQKLYHGERDFGPCAGCDAVSYRTGLLPDKLGKEKLPKPGPSTALQIKKALAGASYARPVKREWE